MSRIEEFFERGVEAGCIPRIPMNYDAVSYKIYTCYLEIKVDALTAEVAELRARLNRSVELPRIVHPNVNEWFVQYQNKYGLIFDNIFYSERAAEARLKELQGGAR